MLEEKPKDSDTAQDIYPKGLAHCQTALLPRLPWARGTLTKWLKVPATVHQVTQALYHQPFNSASVGPQEHTREKARGVGLLG